MATKKKKKSAAKVKPAGKAKKKKKKKKGGRKSGRSRRSGGGGWLALILMIVALGAVFYGMRLFQSKPEVTVAARAVRVMGSAGGGKNQMQSPRGLGVGPQGQIAVADLGNSRIDVYSADGTFQMSFGKPGTEGAANAPGEFREPSGVAVGSDGHFFVADAWNGRIQRFDEKGKFVQEFKGAPYNFYSPRHVTVDGRGNVYVADTGNSQIKIFNLRGGRPTVVGGAGEGDGQFREIFGIAVNSKGEIFAADPGNKRVQKFNPAPGAQFVKAVSIPGWKNSGTFWPHVAVDAQDRVYVTDKDPSKIWIYDSELNYLATLAGPEGQTPFGNPLGLGVLPSGEIVVSDMDGNRLVVLAPVRLPTPAP